MKEHELLKTAVRETRLSAGIASELATIAGAQPEGLPVQRVSEILAYWRKHLEAAHTAVTALEAEANKIKSATLV